jgi:hypothetical protein
MEEAEKAEKEAADKGREQERAERVLTGSEEEDNKELEEVEVELRKLKAESDKELDSGVAAELPGKLEKKEEGMSRAEFLSRCNVKVPAAYLERQRRELELHRRCDRVLKRVDRRKEDEEVGFDTP